MPGARDPSCFAQASQRPKPKVSITGNEMRKTEEKNCQTYKDEGYLYFFGVTPWD